MQPVPLERGDIWKQRCVHTEKAEVMLLAAVPLQRHEQSPGSWQRTRTDPPSQLSGHQSRQHLALGCPASGTVRHSVSTV